MNTVFDEIRCYNNEEIHDALERLTNEKAFMKVLSTVYPLIPKEVIKQRVLGYHSIIDFQKELVFPFLQYIEAHKTKGIALNGSEKLDNSTSYLYISNHRDIILDSALLCAKFLERGMDTVEIAIGDNLLIFPWIEELVKVNKSFIVRRGLSPRQVLESSKLLSEYIYFVLNEKKQSIWIAQREGRAKDSNDRTQESLLKMVNMYGKGTLSENLSKLNICPLAISYEYDPCDYLKAAEFQAKRDNPDFKKLAQDDMISMQTGVMGYKGRVVYTITGDINKELVNIEKTVINKKDYLSTIAQLIDKRIHANYTIFENNKIAYDLLFKTDQFSHDYTMMDKLDFERYLEKQIEKIQIVDKDDDFLMLKLLEMYANPLINHLEAIK